MNLTRTMRMVPLPIRNLSLRLAPRKWQEANDRLMYLHHWRDSVRAAARLSKGDYWQGIARIWGGCRLRVKGVRKDDFAIFHTSRCDVEIWANLALAQREAVSRSWKCMVLFNSRGVKRVGLCRYLVSMVCEQEAISMNRRVYCSWKHF